MKTNEDQLKMSGDAQLRKLQAIVQQTISEEKLMVDNLMHEPREILSRGQTISDKVASFGGSWKFIMAFSVVLGVWIVLNILLPTDQKFDPFPFILMNLVLSAIAAFQAPIIMMSQNRKEEKDRKRSENDYLINLKAELELRSLHQKIDLLLQEQITSLFESQVRQLELLKKIEKRLGES